MKTEIDKVLEMMEEGKVSASEASELISLLKSEPSNDASRQKKPKYMERSLRIRVQQGQEDQVNISIPLKLIKGLLRLGSSIASSIPEAEKHLKAIDVNIIIEAIDQQIEGKIVDIQTEEGESVIISIE